MQKHHSESDEKSIDASRQLGVTMVFGTRPEAIKLAPVIAMLSADRRFSVRVVSTGQHREMVREIIGPLGIRLDVDLDIMKPGQSLNDIVLAALSRLDALYRDDRPEIVVIQGDTSTAFAAALAAFHRRIPVAHVEAGLRSHDRRHPYPEESNRRMISALADLHFAPTRKAAENLMAETTPADAVFVTGNTVIDALGLALRVETSVTRQIEPGRDLVLITLHRREAWDGQAEDGSNVLANILRGIGNAAADHPSASFVYPMHRNPRVRQMAQELAGSVPNLKLIEPLPYFEFVGLMARAKLIVTDSGGIQEEAPSLGVPVLVLRKTTERPEALQSGWNTLVGTGAADIRAAIAAELCVSRLRPAAIPSPSPFGDGRASERIRDALLWFRNRTDPRPSEFSENPTG
jgi:UDP-N-acetylglucosamine 2-epimerase (non-hydrolysing)